MKKTLSKNTTKTAPSTKPSKKSMVKGEMLNKRGTQKQKKLAKVIVENAILDKPLNASEMLANVGYKETVAKHKQKEIIESEGVQTELILLGFDEITAKEVVSTILTNEDNEPRDRLKAADMVFKVHGSYAAEKHLNINLEVSKEEREKILGIASKVIENMTHEEVKS